MKRAWWWISGVLSAFVVIGLALWVWRPQPFLPSGVTAAYPAAVLIPNKQDAALVEGSAAYDKPAKMLSYTVKLAGTNVVISEQPTPENFVDVPQMYDQLVAQMAEYQKFDAAVGTVHLTRPANLAGRQTAVLNTKGTLLFAKAEANLSDDAWRTLFRSFAALRP